VWYVEQTLQPRIFSIFSIVRVCSWNVLKMVHTMREMYITIWYGVIPQTTGQFMGTAVLASNLVPTKVLTSL